MGAAFEEIVKTSQGKRVQNLPRPLSASAIGPLETSYEDDSDGGPDVVDLEVRAYFSGFMVSFL